jgi:protein TonB
MKKLPLVFLLIISFKARSQEKESFYIFDANWKPTKIQPADFFLDTQQVNDSCWQWDYYNYMGPLLKTEHYQDNEGKELNGVSYYYDKKGSVDSMTTYSRGKKNGDSWKWSATPKARMTYRYLNDSLVEFIDPSKSKKDSAVTYKDEKESEYPGGPGGWARYLNRNLEYPERAQQAVIQGDVVVQFIVDKNGNVISPFISRSVEYSLDEVSLKIIRESGKWEPAFQNGHNVKSYKLQPINFRLK